MKALQAVPALALAGAAGDRALATIARIGPPVAVLDQCLKRFG
jgi:hypothetical protein